MLTHHAREPIELEGGTSFHFVTQGFEAESLGFEPVEALHSPLATHIRYRREE